jgi:hypothetical protein
MFVWNAGNMLLFFTAVWRRSCSSKHLSQGQVGQQPTCSVYTVSPNLGFRRDAIRVQPRRLNKTLPAVLISLAVAH